MPDEKGGREGKEDGWRSRILLATLFCWFWFWFFEREGAGIRGIGSVHSFLIGSGLSSWLGVTFRLGCKSTMKGSRRLEGRDG